MEFEKFIKSFYSSDDRIAKMYIDNPVKGTQTYIVSAGNLAEKQYKDEINTYMAMNPLTYRNNGIHRDKQHLARLKWLYIDLDYYKSQYDYMTSSQMLSFLQEEYFGCKVPVPTAVIDSGRGIYLLWKIDEHVNAIPKWYKMQAYLYDQLKELGADCQVVTDSSRVLRQIGSINSKSETKVKLIDLSCKQYSLSNLIREYLPNDDVATDRMISYAKWIANILNVKVPSDWKLELRRFISDNKDAAHLICQLQKSKDRMAGKKKKKSGKKKKKSGKSKFSFIGTEYSLYQARIQDLETLLLKHRDKEGGLRECILFMYRYFKLCITDSKEESLESTLALNSKLHNPLDEKEVVNATKSAEKYYDKGKTYKRKNKHIIEKLQITEDEMQDMKFFVSETEIKRRKAIKNRNDYSRKLEKQGKLTKAEAIKNRNIEMYELLRQGKKQKEICELLKISKSTFYTYKKLIDFTSFCDTKVYDVEHTNNQEKEIELTVDDQVIEKSITSETSEGQEKTSQNDAISVCPENSALVFNKAFRPMLFFAESSSAVPNIFLYDYDSPPD